MRSIGQSRRSFTGLLILSVLMLFTLAATVWAQRPPLIDRELFFGEPFSNAKPITTGTRRPIPGYFWSRDGKYLGGRYQESMTSEVSQRLNEINVDVKTVTMQKVMTESSDLPKPAVDLRPGTYNYKASIALGGQEIPLTTTTDIKEENGAWTVSETNRTPQGDMSNVSTIEKGSLLLKRRLIKQGPVTIEMNVTPTKVSGSTTMNGHTSPFAADPGGALFADGAGTFEVIASLPLADGYSLSFRNFDVLKQKPQIKRLKVLGSETVTVPAGMFDAYKVEIVAADNEADKQTVWIDKGSRKVLKISAVLTWLEGAVLTSELTR